MLRSNVNPVVPLKVTILMLARNVGLIISRLTKLAYFNVSTNLQLFNKVKKIL